MKKPRVIAKRCRVCEECIYECPADAISISSKTHKAWINPKKCVDCGICIKVCPYKAITR